MTQAVYLDYNATAPIRPEAADAALAALKTGGNPSSVHAAGRAARAIVEKAREQVAALVGARPADVIFTSGGTEANALAIESAVLGAGCRRLIIGAIQRRDFPIIQGGLLITAATFVFVNIAVDILYGWLDPRVRDDR